MTFVEKQHANKNYYISLEYENNCIIVQVCPRHDENLCGYPIRKMTYSINEKEKANATFKRYIKKYI